jgi:hypothetical protein
VRKKELTKIWPNLVFFNFEYRNMSSLHCENCKAIKLNYLKDQKITEIQLHEHETFPQLVCKFHKSPQKEFIPNVAVIWRENERGIFEEYVLSDEMFENNVEKTSNVYKFDYFTNENIQPYVTESSVPFNQQPVITKCFTNQLETKVASKKRTIIYKFLQLVTQSSWRNSTLISWNDKYSHLSSVLEALISVGCIPKILHKKRKLYSVTLEKHNLRFIDACNFFSGHLHDVASQYEIKFERMFFPNR